MAARKKPLHPVKIENMKEKIKTTLLIKMLQDHALEDNGASNSRIDAAKFLLNKVISNAPAITENDTTLSGTIGVNQVKTIRLIDLTSE